MSSNIIPLHGNSILIISACKQNPASLRTILREPAWKVQLRRHSGEISVVIYEHSSLDEGWKPLLREFDEMPMPPKLILYSSVADERLWEEVLNFGAFDLFYGPPFDTLEVLHIVESARLAWNRADGGAVLRRPQKAEVHFRKHSGGMVGTA